jgi:integrase
MVLGGTAALLKLELLAPTRISEALALTRTGPRPSLTLPDHEGTVIINLPGEKTKTGRPYYREVPENEGDGLREILCWYKMRIRPLVLTHSWGKASSKLRDCFFPITRGRAYDWIRKVSRRDDLEINPHLLRSILASFLLADGESDADDAAGLLNIGRETALKYYLQKRDEEIAMRARSRSARRLKKIRLGTDAEPAA